MRGERIKIPLKACLFLVLVCRVVLDIFVFAFGPCFVKWFLVSFLV